jgi:hypothetical protein
MCTELDSLPDTNLSQHPQMDFRSAARKLARHSSGMRIPLSLITDSPPLDSNGYCFMLRRRVYAD